MTFFYKKFKKIAVIIIFNALICLCAFAESVVMNVVASNSTNEKKERMPIRQDLPKEIKKEHVVEASGMEILYDEEKTIFYLYTEADLGPKESKSYKVVLKDVWTIPQEQFDFLKSQAEERTKSLSGAPEAEIAKNFSSHLNQEMEQIKIIQESQKSDVSARIDSYRVNLQRLADIRQSITLVEDFKKEAERYSDVSKENRIIKFVVEVENPSSTNTLEQAEIIRYLPDGVKPDQLVDRQGFDVKYDPEKNAFYLMQTLDLKPAEKKKYEILIQDVWFIPEPKLDDIQTAAETLGQKMGGSQYNEAAAFLVLEIKKNVTEIKEAQTQAVTPIEKIAAYTSNIKKLELIRRKVDELRRMVEEMDKAKAKKLTQVIKSVTPDVAATWKLIYATIGFLTVISVLFFFLWFGQTKAKQGQKIETHEPPKS